MFRLLKRVRKIVSSISEQHGRQQQRLNGTLQPGKSYRVEKQDICVVDIDPKKLMSKLRQRYNSDFEVSVSAMSATAQPLDANRTVTDDA
jgi:hypothetical protein